MRGVLIPVALLANFTLAGQDWALLNPAYRYNYSNDGTDTIRHQIRVMQVDTLGPDSFRYELNRIGVVCDTCPASLGGPCDGCFVRMNQPQFLGYECVRMAQEWHFNGRDTFLIQPFGELGATWSFSGSITATVEALWTNVLWGIADSLKRIQLSNGGSIVLSKSFGVLAFHALGAAMDLIGVKGADVGRFHPDVLSYFDYQIGDELVYREGGVYSVDFQGGPSGIPYPLSIFWKVVITGRSESPDGILYSTSVARTFAGAGTGSSASGPYLSCSWTRPWFQWTFTRSQIIAQHAILDSYPGQVLDTAVCWLNPGWHDYDTRVIAETAISVDGKTIMRSKAIGLANPFNPQSLTGAFDGEDGVGDDLFPALQIKVNQHYVEGLGLKRVEYNEGTNYIVDLDLRGAIIGGDTIIAPPTINWVVGVEEQSLNRLSIHPNPADEACWITGFDGSRTIHVFDLEGRQALTTSLLSSIQPLDIRSLAAGAYVIQIEGHLPQRLVITR